MSAAETGHLVFATLHTNTETWGRQVIDSGAQAGERLLPALDEAVAVAEAAQQRGVVVAAGHQRNLPVGTDRQMASVSPAFFMPCMAFEL